MSPVARELVRWARTVHLYLTLFALALVLFFTVTGFMLNHEDWFVPPDSFTREQKGTIPPELLADPLDKLAVAELLRKDFGAVGLVSSFEVEEDRPLRVVFKRPGTEVEALIERDTGETTVTIQTRGANAVMLDLHRGKSTGLVWSLVIDVTCAVMMVLAATGIIMWWSLRGRGRYGLLVLGLGTAISVAIVFRYAM